MWMHGKRPDGTADLPPTVPDKRPIAIKRDRFVATIYDVGNLMDFPMTNLRKLWAIMFDAPVDNEQTIAVIRDWLPAFVKECEDAIPRAEAELADAKATAARKHSEDFRMGDGYWRKQVDGLKRALKAARTNERKEELTRALETATAHRDAPKIADKAVKAIQSGLNAAKARHEKADKLHTIFTDMAAKAGL
jgi:hypothetical protein